MRNENTTEAMHKDMVMRLVKDPDQPTDEQRRMLHMLMGLAGEVGELIDTAKKSWIYNAPLNIENVIEELGDIEFYLEGFRQIHRLPREHVLEVNYRKLRQRYKNFKYSDEAARARADKA